MSEIRAAALKPGEVLDRSFPKSPVPEDGLIVKILQCGVCGSDKHMLAGHLKLAFPIVPGHELVAEVAEVGPKANETRRRHAQLQSLRSVLVLRQRTDSPHPVHEPPGLRLSRR